MTQKRNLQKIIKWVGVTVGYFSHFCKKLNIKILNTQNTINYSRNRCNTVTPTQMLVATVKKDQCTMKNIIYFLILFLICSCNFNSPKSNDNKVIDSTRLRNELIEKATTAINPEIINSKSSKDSSFIKYQNTSHSFSIDYPKNWKAIENYNPVIVFIANDNNPKSECNFNVIVIPDETRSLDDVFSANKREMEMYIKDVKCIGNGETVALNDLKYKKLISDFTNPKTGKKQRTVTYSFVKNKKSYIITFSTKPSAYSSNVTLFDLLIRTFKIN